MGSNSVFSFRQMEELVGTRNPHSSHDLLLLLHHLPGPHGAYDDCEYSMLTPLLSVRCPL